MKYSVVHYMGDSHARNYAHIPHFILHSVDSTTMYWATTVESDDYFNAIPKEGLWLFGYGDVDVRCLIKNQIVEKGREELEVLATLAENYVNRITKLHTHVGVVGVLPPGECNVPDYRSSTEFTRGTDEERRRYTFVLNALLSYKCMEKGIIFIDIYHDLKNEKGYLIREISNDDIHLSEYSKIDEILQRYQLVD